jgi:hypothetical protein
VSPNQLDYYREEGNISEADLALTTECDIKKAQHAAYKNLKSLQAQHQELRESYLEGLAEVIISLNIRKTNSTTKSDIQGNPKPT